MVCSLQRLLGYRWPAHHQAATGNKLDSNTAGHHAKSLIYCALPTASLCDEENILTREEQGPKNIDLLPARLRTRARVKCFKYPLQTRACNTPMVEKCVQTGRGLHNEMVKIRVRHYRYPLNTILKILGTSRDAAEHCADV